ncbi:cytochrome P450 [Russula earlei]|uniref:Cytochrome P450 n=1 Tax=Russula earlei TaxID=71964 RepID=A0ACC0U824_9AGAM|nr:cytochrome P450 [Russula earlei]
MYPFGLITFLQFAWEHELPSLLALMALGLFLSFVSLCYCSQPHPDAPVTLPGLPLINVTTFLKRRHDFLAWGFKVTNQRLFQFRLLRNKVVVVSGDRGRRDFFTAKGLDLQEGFRILSGGLPMIHGVTIELRQQRVARIYKRLVNVQRNERLTELIPEILNDSQRLLRPWKKVGTFDPFSTIYELVFQAAIRCLACTEIADDPEIVAHVRHLYDQIDRGTTPATVLFPWFPSPSMIMKARATKQLYDITVKAIKVRKESGVPRNDTLQIFLDSGDELTTIVGFTMGFVMAGARSTNATASWLLTYLGCYPKWRNEARTEVEKLVTLYALETITERDTQCHSSSALSSIPLAAWENETPVLDMLIHETLRIAQPHVAMRRNLGPETYIDGKVIPTGTLLVYPFASVHLDPALYPDPWKFDPARSQPKDNLAYVGWGGGRVTCLGSRLARLKIKLLTALMVLDFDFDTVDVSGRIADSPPKPDWNDILTCRPAHGQFFIAYKRRDAFEPSSCRSPGTGPL